MNVKCIFSARDIIFVFFFFNDTATTEIYTLSLHDALPIFVHADHDDVTARLLVAADAEAEVDRVELRPLEPLAGVGQQPEDRKSTRLNSSHANISYAVFCLKKKKYLKYSTYSIELTSLVQH